MPTDGNVDRTYQKFFLGPGTDSLLKNDALKHIEYSLAYQTAPIEMILTFDYIKCGKSILHVPTPS